MADWWRVVEFPLGNEVILHSFGSVKYLEASASGAGIAGILYVTNYRLVWQSDTCAVVDKSKQSVKITRATDLETVDTIGIPLASVNSVAKIGGVSNLKVGLKERSRDTIRHFRDRMLEIRCKDFRFFRFQFAPKSGERGRVYEVISRATSVGSPTNLFAFQTQEYLGPADRTRVYDPHAEFERQGLGSFPDWRFTDVNQMYRLTETYPTVLVVPARLQDMTISVAARFRTANRFPVLSWKHPTNNAAITRCADAGAGLGKGRSPEDEAFVEALAKTNPASARVYIFDVRSQRDALSGSGDKAGKTPQRPVSFDPAGLYQHATVEFLGLDTNAALAESVRKLQDQTSGADDNTDSNEEGRWLSRLDNTGWLWSVRALLAAAQRVATTVDKRAVSVCVQCPEGRDGSSAVVALAMLLLDPYYRTVDGFMVLIEKEWLAMGHPFAVRLGHVSMEKASDPQRAPHFLLFMDAVHQVMSQAICSFEFNDDFLVCILFHVFSCRFGTFLGNSDRDRTEKHLDTSTSPLWAYLRRDRDVFRNPYFAGRSGVLDLCVSMRTIELWRAFFFRSNTALVDKESPDQMVFEMLAELDDLRAKINDLGGDRAYEMQGSLSRPESLEEPL